MWNQNVISFYKRIEFKPLIGDPNILIQYVEDENSIVSIYIDNFLLASNAMATLKALKVFFAKKYDTKDLGKVQTIMVIKSIETL